MDKVKRTREPQVPSPYRLTDDDVYLFGEGMHYRLYEKM